MRILILSQYFEPEVGAPQVRLAAFVRELVHQGHDVEVVTAFPNHPTGRIFQGYRGRFLSRETWEGATILHRVWVYAAQGAGMKRLANYLSFALTSLIPMARCQRPDLLFVESPPLFLSIPAWMLCKWWRIPMVFNVADLWPDSVEEMGFIKEGLMLRVARRLEQWSYARAHLVNAVTEGIRKTLIDKKRLAPGKVTFMPNGVDTTLFAPGVPDLALVEELGLLGRKFILYAGTVGLAQGLDVALDAMKIVAPNNINLLMVFLGDGSDRRRLEGRVRAEGIPGVCFLDARPVGDVAKLYRSAEAGFASLRDLPLFEGARPSKIFPVMASAVPVLYSGAGEGARLITEAGAGLAVPPEDPMALAGAIQDLIGDPEAAHRMGLNGRRFVESRLTWSSLVQKWLKQVESAGILTTAQRSVESSKNGH